MNATYPGYELWIACKAHLLAGQTPQAIETCEKATGTRAAWQNHLLLAAAYANNDDMEHAAASRAEVLRVVPGYTISQLRAKRYSDHPDYQRLAEKFWYEGLRKAGIPES
jgi:hypothetical protein